MGTVAGLQLVIFMFFIFCSILVVILMCPLMDLVGKNKKIMTAINSGDVPYCTFVPSFDEQTFRCDCD